MTLSPYIRIARPDNWFKNVFMIPGIILAFFFQGTHLSGPILLHILAGLAVACVVASSNYVINEIVDAKKDMLHPEKRTRPIPGGLVKLPLAYTEYVLLSVIGIFCGFLISPTFGWSALLLWVMGIVYNIYPIRTKRLPYLDVMSEAVNNPIRLAMGWYSVGSLASPPLSFFMAYWMFGAFLMAAKRFAEYRMLGEANAAAYRESFGYYNEERLMGSIVFYAALFAMMSGIFIARYRIEMILATPLIAYAMAFYFHLSFKPNSPVQHPEFLYREPWLMVTVGLAFVACVLLLFLDIPGLQEFFNPWITRP